LYILGLMGATRRVNVFEDDAYNIWLYISTVGVVIVAAGIGAFVVQLWVSFRNRAALRDVTGDPWDGRTLEWSTASPTPDYNFAMTPKVYEIDAWWDMKKHGYQRPVSGFKALHMPKNTGAGFVI